MGHFAHSHFSLCLKVGGDIFLPCVSFIARRLLWHDMFALEIFIRPPRRFAAIHQHRFGKYLIAVTNERVGIDLSYLNWPKATPTGFIAQIAVFVRGTDEDALPRFDHLFPSIARTIMSVTSWRSTGSLAK